MVHAGLSCSNMNSQRRWENASLQTLWGKCDENPATSLSCAKRTGRNGDGTGMLQLPYERPSVDGKLKDKIESGSIQKDLWGQDPHRERRALLRQAIDETIKRILSRPCLHTIGGFP